MQENLKIVYELGLVPRLFKAFSCGPIGLVYKMLIDCLPSWAAPAQGCLSAMVLQIVLHEIFKNRIIEVLNITALLLIEGLETLHVSVSNCKAVWSLELPHNKAVWWQSEESRKTREKPATSRRWSDNQEISTKHWQHYRTGLQKSNNL